jgi:hypothetical protein
LAGPSEGVKSCPDPERLARTPVDPMVTFPAVKVLALVGLLNEAEAAAC